jgi:hypothetical protein
MDIQHNNRQHKFLFVKYMRPISMFLLFSFLLFNVFTTLNAAEQHTFEAEAANLIGGASKVGDDAASGGYFVSLTKPGEGFKFARLPANWRFAIRRWEWV